MYKFFIVLLLTISISSCDFLKQYIKESETTVFDKAPPKDHNPVFISEIQKLEQKPDSLNLTISRIDGKSSDKVKVFFHLTKGNTLYTGASSADFNDIFCEVYDSGQASNDKITNFKIRESKKAERQKLAIAIVMDHSGSMGAKRAMTVQSSISKLINEKNDDDMFALIRYDSKIKVEVPLTKDKSTLLAKHPKNGLKGYGGLTATTDAIIKAINELKSAPADYQRVVVVFADGKDNSSKQNEATLIDLAQSNNTIVSTIDYGYYITKGYLKNIAENCQGIYHHIYLTDEFTKVFDDLYNRMNYYYVLEFDQPNYGDHNLKMKICLNGKESEDEAFYNNVPLPGSIIILNVYFDTGKSSLKKESDEAIKRLLKLLELKPNSNVEIHGHTDNVGKEESNQKLSEERALSVKNELIKNGISENRITSIGHGDTKPIADNSSSQGRAKNRRTEFLIK